jgi:hypothetical protein
MTAAAKQGNPDRLITYNSCILPKVSDFYEVFAGENDFSAEMIDGFGFLPVGGSGKFTGAPQSGLQGQITTIINGDWGHFKVNTPISPPRYSSDTMIAKIQDASSRRNVPTFDVEIYQDGRMCGRNIICACLKCVRFEGYSQDLLRYTRQAGRGMHASITILRYQQESAVSIALE